MWPLKPNSDARSLSLVLCLIGSGLLALIFYALFSSQQKNRIERLIINQQGVLDQAEEIIDDYLSSAERDISFLSHSPLLNSAFNNSASGVGVFEAVESEWQALMQSRMGLYSQLRYIDNDGREQLRINNVPPASIVVPPAGLQNKVNRYYVNESLALSRGAIYLSDFDLNVENGVIEFPLNPTLRVAAPVFDDSGAKRGVITLNYKGSEMIRALRAVGSSAGQDLWLVNSQGYWLVGPSADVEWGFMYPNRLPQLFATDFPLLWSGLEQEQFGYTMRSEEHGYQLTVRKVSPAAPFRHLFENIVVRDDQHWVLVAAQTPEKLAAITTPIIKSLAPTFIVLELLIIGFSLWGGRQLRLRVQAIRETEKRERQLQVIFEAAPDATLMSDTNGVITRANSAVTKVLGYAPSELIGQSIDILVPDHVFEGHPVMRGQYYSNPSPRSVTSRERLQAKHKDGHEVPVSIALNSLIIDGQRQVVSAVRDMSADYQAGRELTLLNQRLEIATSAAGIGIWEYDTRSGAVKWDDQMFAHYRLPKDFEIDIRSWMNLFDEEHQQQFRRRIRATILDGTEFDMLAKAQSGDGHEIWLRLIATTKLDIDGFTETLVGTQLDVTDEVSVERELRIAYERASEANVELEALNQELEEARESAEIAAHVKSDFLANMSHEIRTPLNAVLGLNHLLERQLTDATARDLITKQDRAAQTLLGIVNDVLDYSKIESGKLELEESPFSIMDLLDNLTTLVGGQAVDKGLSWVVVPPPLEECNVIGDYMRLEQVLVNLAGNAVKFTEQGEVQIRVSSLSNDGSKLKLRFSVSDTGIGISRSAQSSLFDPFTQADVSISRRFGGSGLGLSISNKLVTLMGSQIQIESEVGEGSRFNFTLALSRQSIKRRSLDKLLDSNCGIATSSASLSHGLSAIAASFGAQCQCFASAEDMVAAVVEQQALQSQTAFMLIDATDYMVPDLEHALKSLLRLGDKQRPKVIVIVNASQTEESNFAELAAVDLVLQTPIGPMTLYTAIDALFRGDATMPKTSIERRLAGSRILVVDDNEINLDVAKMMFEEEGARIWLANDGQEAVDFVLSKAHSVDLVLMDVQMPGMDGLEATRLIRQSETFKDLPILALTAGVTPAQRSAAMEAGMNGFITKPIDLDRSVALLRSVLSADYAAPVVKHDANQSAGATNPQVRMLNEAYGLRVFKTQEKYQRYLYLFIQMYNDAPRRLSRLTDEPEELRSLVHKMRGGAGHLGMEALRDRCAQIESAIEERQPFLESVLELQTELKVMFDLIHERFPIESSEPSEDQVMGNKQQLRQQMVALHQALADYDLDQANRIFSTIRGSFDPEQRAGMQTALDLFDAPSALQVFDSVAEAQQISLPDIRR